MKTKTTVPISSARKNIFSIAEEVQKPDVYYTLTERGKPKAVIVSAQRFEDLIEKKLRMMERKEEMMLAEGGSNYWTQNAHVFQKVLIIRDESKVVYVSPEKENLRRKKEELVKAQLYVELIERYKYPLDLVEIGKYVKVGGSESKRYIEADIVINERNGNVKVIFEVTNFNDYEELQDERISDLFQLADALTWGKKPQFLVYFSRSYENGARKEKVMVIDYIKHGSFLSWKRADRPAGKEIPMFI